jgi:hypothetical protein
VNTEEFEAMVDLTACLLKMPPVAESSIETSIKQTLKSIQKN